MFGAISSHPICLLVIQSDWMSKFVLFVLLILSVASWSVFFYKIIVWGIRRKQIKEALAYLKNANNLEDVFYTASKYANTLPGYLLNKKLSFVKTLLVNEKGTRTELSSREWELLLDRINQLLDSVLLKEESMLPIVSIAAQVGPLLGLFGTVWGLVHAFIDISQKQSADISVVAPGIAEALVTTVAGLLVAIPAVVIFNYLTLRAKDIDLRVSNLAGRFIWIVNKNVTKTEKEG